jgi:hypothetical protein
VITKKKNRETTYMLYFCVVKRAFAYFLLVVVLFQQTEFHQILNVPALIIHYFDHSEKEGQLSFVRFIHDHYCEEHHKCDHKDERNHEFPYQSCDASHFNTICVVSQPQEFALLTFDQHIKHAESHSEYFFSESLIDIWQPPKL